MRKHGLVLGIAAVAVAVGFGFALWAPPDELQGDFVRIMFVHVPSAWLAFLAFGVTLVGSIAWLITKRMTADRIAASSARVGVFFTALALLTGMVWGRPVWGTFWDWGDARMMTTAIMFFVYLGYLALRRVTPDPQQRARRAALLGVVAFVQVPLVHFSVLWWRTLHQVPTVARPDPTIDSRMLTALMVNLAAFTIIYVAFTALGSALQRYEDAVAARRLAEATTPAGAAVTSPDLEAVKDV